MLLLVKGVVNQDLFQRFLLLVMILAAASAIAAFGVPHVNASPSAMIQNDSFYISASLGWYVIVGEVLNTGDVALRFIFVTATLKDSSGIVVDSLQTVALSDYLPAALAIPAAGRITT